MTARSNPSTSGGSASIVDPGWDIVDTIVKRAISRGATAIGLAVLATGCGAGTGHIQSEALPPRLQSEPLSVSSPASARGIWPVLAGVAATEITSTGTIVARGAVPLIDARAEPDDAAPIVSTFPHPTERGGPQVFQALGEPIGGWLEVRLPVRPNGTTGWIRVTDVTLTRNPYRLVLDAGAHQLSVFRDDELVLTTTVAIGTGETPTPIGDFYLIELLQPTDPNGVYGPYAYGLSGFSDTLTTVNGGVGVIGIHGTNRPDLLGSDVSHGCVRVDNEVITELATFLPLGTPISIRRDDLAVSGDQPL